MLKTISLTTQTTGSISGAAQGAAIATAHTKSIGAQVTTVGAGTGTVQLQKSNDGTNWANDGSSVSISAAGVYWVEKIDPTSLYMRLSFTVSASSYTANSVTLVQGDR